MSQEDRKLMQLMDEYILNASPEELTKLQQADINTQLDGIWFYDICDILDQKQKKRDITTNKLFFKIIIVFLNLNVGTSGSIICQLNLKNQVYEKAHQKL